MTNVFFSKSVLLYSGAKKRLLNITQDASIDWANEANVAPLNEPFCGYMHNKIVCLNGMNHTKLGLLHLVDNCGKKPQLNVVLDANLVMINKNLSFQVALTAEFEERS